MTVLCVCVCVCVLCVRACVRVCFKYLCAFEYKTDSDFFDSIFTRCFLFSIN